MLSSYERLAKTLRWLRNLIELLASPFAVVKIGVIYGWLVSKATRCYGHNERASRAEDQVARTLRDMERFASEAWGPSGGAVARQ